MLLLYSNCFQVSVDSLHLCMYVYTYIDTSWRLESDTWGQSTLADVETPSRRPPTSLGTKYSALLHSSRSPFNDTTDTQVRIEAVTIPQDPHQRHTRHSYYSVYEGSFE